MLKSNNIYLTDSLGRYLTGSALTLPNEFYFGVVVGGARPTVIELAELNRAEYMQLTQMQLVYPPITGWVIFAELTTAPLRTQWRIDNFSGAIGGAVSIDGNVWAAPTRQQFGGNWFNVYISNWQTRITQPVIIT